MQTHKQQLFVFQEDASNNGVNMYEYRLVFFLDTWPDFITLQTKLLLTFNIVMSLKQTSLN